MSFEFLVFSDFHAHNHTYCATRTSIPGIRGLYNSRLADSVAVLDEIVEYAKDHKIKHVVFCGDLFHRRTSVFTDVRYVVTDRLHKFVEEGITLYMIPGNHDMGDRKGNVHSLVGLGELSPYINVYNKVSLSSLDAVDFVFVPYTDSLDEAKNMLEKAGDLAALSPKPTILFAHLGMQGAKVGSDYVLVADSDISVTDVPSSKFVACFFGHFHEHQQLFLNGWYVGATHEHNWGDAGGSRGYLHVNVEDDGKVSFKQIKTSAPNFVVRKDEEIVVWKHNDFLKVITKEKFLDKEALKKEMGITHLEIVTDTEEDNTEFTLDTTQLSPLSILEQWVDKKLPQHLDRDEVLDIGKDILKEIGI
jgi:DNA repair exonuclease SbcCD nuclease subunit